MIGLKWDAKGKVATAAAALTVVGTVSPLRPVVFLGTSMSPTYPNRSIGLATREVGTLKRGDVVVAETPEGTVVKRVGLIAGDGYYEKHRYGQWFSMLTVGRNLHKGEERFVTIPAGTVFLVGDNRVTSIDSRHFGPVPLSKVRLKLIDDRPTRGDIALHGAVLRKNLVLNTPKPVVE